MRTIAAICFLAALGLPAAAQTVPRIKAKLVSFDGRVLTVLPDGETATMKIAIRPATRIIREEQKSLADIHAGDFIGATVTAMPGGWRAQEVHVFPDAMRGAGEGLYPATPGASRYVLNGAVADISPGAITLHFRGASGEGAQCTGRAPADPLTGCQGAAKLAVDAAAPVLALVPGDKTALTPGAVLALSVMAGPDGQPVTPGLTIETVQTPPVPLAPSAEPAAQHPHTAPVKKR